MPRFAKRVDMDGSSADLIQKIVSVPKGVPTVPETVVTAVRNRTQGWVSSGDEYS